MKYFYTYYLSSKIKRSILLWITEMAPIAILFRVFAKLSRHSQKLILQMTTKKNVHKNICPETLQFPTIRHIVLFLFKKSYNFRNMLDIEFRFSIGTCNVTVCMCNRIKDFISNIQRQIFLSPLILQNKNKKLKTKYFLNFNYEQNVL